MHLSLSLSKTDLEPLAERSPDCFKELHKRGSLVLYELDPKVPLVYVVPSKSEQFGD